MYNPMRSGNKRFFVAISIILAAIFITICSNSVYGVTQSQNTEKKFKSEEDLIDETRRQVESHLGDTAPVRAYTGEEVEERSDKPIEVAAAKEEPRVEAQTSANQDPVKEGAQAPVEEKQPPVEEKQVASEEGQPAVDPKPISQEDTSPVPNKQTSQQVADPNAAVSGSAEQPGTVQNSPAEQAGAAENNNTSDFVEETGDLPSDVTPVAVGDVNKPIAQAIDFSLSKGLATKKAVEEPILKKMDVNKIGASPYYETYEGLRLLKYFTVAQRVEIYQEPRPIDSYMLDAMAMRYLYQNTPWNIRSDYRRQLVPIFIRAYGTEVTISDPKNKEGQIRYTIDYRDIYKNYWPKYPNIKRESWDQNEVLLMHSKLIEPINWLYTSNLGYRFSTMQCKSDAPFYSYYEQRSTYFGSFSIAPTDKVEYFAQGEYYKSSHVKCSWANNPDHFLGRGEIRIKSKDYKTMFVPQFSYSKDLYYPFADSFEKYEIAFRVGRDWTKRFSTTHTLQYVYSYRDEPDNQAPYYNGTKFPERDKAEYLSLQNRFSYNVYDRLYLQVGADVNNGVNWSQFDNLGLLGGVEYYAPGMIRVNVGYRGNYYYNLADWLSSIYFKFYLFM